MEPPPPPSASLPALALLLPTAEALPLPPPPAANAPLWFGLEGESVPPSPYNSSCLVVAPPSCTFIHLPSPLCTGAFATLPLLLPSVVAALLRLSPTSPSSSSSSSSSSSAWGGTEQVEVGHVEGERDASAQGMGGVSPPQRPVFIKPVFRAPPPPLCTVADYKLEGEVRRVVVGWQNVAVCTVAIVVVLRRKTTAPPTFFPK